MPTGDLPSSTDVVVVGAGHNGLVAATVLAGAGLDVLVLERAETLGGATRTEQPFPTVPGLRHSTGAYLLGLMPPEVLALAGGRIRPLRRDPHYVLPTAGGPGSPYLVFGSDRAATRAQMERMFSAADVRADDALQAELDQLREDLAPAWLAEPLTVEATAERYVRAELRDVFVDLVRGSVVHYLDRFGFESELLVAMYAVTDGLSGLTAGPDTPGSGHNFLVHNMCRLPGADGTWMIAEGGMGAVSGGFAEAAAAHGARLVTGAEVTGLVVESGTAAGVVLADGTEVRARAVLGACDPWRTAAIAGEHVPVALAERLERVRRPGTTLKVNLALRDLPRLACLPDDAPSPWGSTVHLLPDATGRPLEALRTMWADVQVGRLPAVPTMEWYVHTTVDPSLRDEAGHHSSALFVQSVPYEPQGGWDEALDGYVDHLLGVVEEFAPGTRDLVADVFPLTPPGIEEHFGISHGHIHHVDNGVAFADRVPYATGLDGLYAGSAGCHPAGSVIGAAGHNSARRVLADLGVATPR
ncbi:MAG TPA: NAD(P)/FAD-dependent oxidoreductase [Jiangellales bacterium]|nr:NAD(P)/FAD-dependent oxidoreductase [Jiangellales bacterium]